MSFPFFMIPIFNSIVFGVNEVAKTILDFDDDTMNFNQGIISGAIGGFFVSFVVTPCELVKCRMQVQYESKEKSIYKGSWHCFTQTMRNEGIKGLFNGLLITLLREVPGYAAQFAAYYEIRSLICKLRNKDNKDLNFIELMVSGGIGGMCCWGVSYPQVSIKTDIF